MQAGTYEGERGHPASQSDTSAAPCNFPLPYGVGSFLLRSFFEAHRDCRQFELFVLADNQRAIHVYQKYGFSTAERLQGFSIDNRDLPCLRMVKTI